MKNLKNNRQKGITLIALVVTIVVLIILATVSILTVFGDNGIISRAEESKKQTKEAMKKEEITLAVAASYNNEGKIDHNLLKDNLNKIEGIKTIQKINTDEEKRAEAKVEALPLVVFTDDDDVIFIAEDGTSTRKAKPSKDVDINGDGIINFVDFQILYNYVNNELVLTDEQMNKGDIDGDGEINLSDVALLIRYINGKTDI